MAPRRERLPPSGNVFAVYRQHRCHAMAHGADTPYFDTVLMTRDRVLAQRVRDASAAQMEREQPMDTPQSCLVYIPTCVPPSVSDDACSIEMAEVPTSAFLRSGVQSWNTDALNAMLDCYYAESYLNGCRGGAFDARVTLWLYTALPGDANRIAPMTFDEARRLLA